MASSAVISDTSAPTVGLASLVPVQVDQTPPSSRKTPSTTKCLLPYIDPSHGAMEIVKSEAQSSPSPLTNDFLPQALLLSLKRHGGGRINGNSLSPPKGGTQLPVPGRCVPSPQAPSVQKNVTNLSTKPPANVWNHPNRRAKLKHLIDAPPCICGAGKDISFLYDVSTFGTEYKVDNGGSKVHTKMNNVMLLIVFDYFIPVSCRLCSQIH